MSTLTRLADRRDRATAAPATMSVVIPCCNEAQGLKRMLADAPRIIDQLIVVDNGSTDETIAVASAYEAQVVQERRRGVGHAYQQGLSHATGEFIVCLDGDASYPLHLVDQLVAIMQAHQLDVLSGCRFPLSRPAAMCLRNQVGNRLLTWLANRLFGLRLRDVMSGMWVLRRSILPRLSWKEGGTPSCVEVKLSAFLNPQLRCAEAHIPYAPRLGHSKLAPWRDGWRCVCLLVRWRLRGRTAWQRPW